MPIANSKCVVHDTTRLFSSDCTEAVKIVAMNGATKHLCKRSLVTNVWDAVKRGIRNNGIIIDRK